MTDHVTSAKLMERASWTLEAFLGMKLKNLSDFLMSTFAGMARLKLKSERKLGNQILNTVMEVVDLCNYESGVTRCTFTKDSLMLF